MAGGLFVLPKMHKITQNSLLKKHGIFCLTFSFLKNVDFPLDRMEGSSYNTTVRGVSRTISYPGVAQLVARMVRDHEAVSSNLATRTS